MSGKHAPREVPRFMADIVDIVRIEPGDWAVYVLIPVLIGLLAGVVARWWLSASGWKSRRKIELACALAGVAASVVVLFPEVPLRGNAWIELYGVAFSWLIGVFVLCVGFAAGWFLSRLVIKRRDATRCEHCGYSLRGLTGNPIRCPECGEVQQTESES